MAANGRVRDYLTKPEVPPPALRPSTRQGCASAPLCPISAAVGRADHSPSPFRASRTHASAAATSLRLAPCIRPRLSRTSSNATRACCSIQRSPRRTRTPGAGMTTSFLGMVALQSTAVTKTILGARLSRSSEVTALGGVNARRFRTRIRKPGADASSRTGGRLTAKSDCTAALFAGSVLTRRRQQTLSSPVDRRADGAAAYCEPGRQSRAVQRGARIARPTARNLSPAPTRVHSRTRSAVRYTSGQRTLLRQVQSQSTRRRLRVIGISASRSRHSSPRARISDKTRASRPFPPET
jgi:hypothetical protein